MSAQHYYWADLILKCNFCKEVKGQGAVVFTYSEELSR